MMAFRRMACLTLLFILLSAAITASAYAPYEKLHVTNCDAWVSLREAPTADSRRVMQLPLGALVSFVDENGDFLKVSYSGTMGYVGREYLRATSDDDRVPMYVANCSEWISLREGETKDSARLTKIPLGTRVLSCGRTADPDAMARVAYDHYSGYVLPEYLSLLPPEAGRMRAQLRRAACAGQKRKRFCSDGRGRGTPQGHGSDAPFSGAGLQRAMSLSGAARTDAARWERSQAHVSYGRLRRLFYDGWIRIYISGSRIRAVLDDLR